MNAYRAYKRGDEIRKPHNWLIKIAHNVARTRYARASRRVKEVPLEEHVDQLAVPEDERPNIEGVLRALGRLPFNQRAALLMRELEGRSYAEIADTLEVSVSAVETLIFRARKALRLRASSVRVLTTVPLPGSLTQIFHGGTLVAGGGAAVGTGVLAKVAVAFVAGALATSLGGDRAGPAEAAPQVESGPVAPAWTAGNGLLVRTAVLPLGKRVATGPTKSVSTRPQSTGEIGQAGAGETAAATASAPPSEGVPAASTGPPAPTSAVQEAASAVVSKVEETAAALPVEVPSVPAVPVEVPPVPPLPKLP